MLCLFSKGTRHRVQRPCRQLAARAQVETSVVQLACCCTVQGEYLPGAAATQERMGLSVQCALLAAALCKVRTWPTSSHTRAVVLKRDADQGSAPLAVRKEGAHQVHQPRRAILSLNRCAWNSAGLACSWP